MKSILHVMGMDSSKYGGIENFNVELSKQLNHKGYHSIFIYESMPTQQEFVNDLISTGADIYVIDSRSNIFLYLRKIWAIYKKGDICLVHAHFTKARFYVLPLALLCGINNLVYTIHSTIQPINIMKLHTRIWYAIMNKKCRVIAVSKQIEKDAKLYWHDLHVQTLYLGVNEIQGDRYQMRKKINIDDSKLVLTSIANFNDIKGLDILCKAVKLLLNRRNDLNFVIYILGQPLKEMLVLKELINNLGINNYIELIGITNEISKYLMASNIYIQTSRKEGLPLSLMEATSAGLPIIASRVGGIPEIAKENVNALLFESENQLELSHLMERMLIDESIRNSYGLNSKKIYNEHFTINKNVEKLINYYNLE